MKIIDDSIFEIYNLIINAIPDAYGKISLLCQKFYAIFKNTSETLFLFTLFFIRFLILISFLYDVFIFFRLEIMYKVISLLCISLIIRILFFLLRDFASNLENIQNDLDIVDKGIDAITGLPKIGYKFKSHVEKGLDLSYHVGQYILCSKLTGYLETYDRYSTFFTPYFSLLLYSLYLLGWLYVLYMNYIFIGNL
jgi:hypothetical protein